MQNCTAYQATAKGLLTATRRVVLVLWSRAQTIFIDRYFCLQVSKQTLVWDQARLAHDLMYFFFNIFFTQAHRDEVITMVANPVVDQVISAGLGELRISKCTLQITVKKFLSPGRKIRGHGCVQQLSLRPISTLVFSERFSIFILRFSY